MSHLDDHIRQKIAQRDCINLAARLVAGREGIIVEFGLGLGRSHSHLAERCPEREIYCFDRMNKTHPRSEPPADHMILGEFTELLQDAALHARFTGRVILAHLDIGCGGPSDDWLPELIADRIRVWLLPGAVVLSDQELTLDPAWRLEALDTRGEVQHADLFHLYRHLPD